MLEGHAGHVCQTYATSCKVLGRRSLAAGTRELRPSGCPRIRRTVWRPPVRLLDGRVDDCRASSLAVRLDRRRPPGCPGRSRLPRPAPVSRLPAARHRAPAATAGAVRRAPGRVRRPQRAADLAAAGVGGGASRAGRQPSPDGRRCAPRTAPVCGTSTSPCRSRWRSTSMRTVRSKPGVSVRRMAGLARPGAGQRVASASPLRGGGPGRRRRSLARVGRDRVLCRGGAESLHHRRAAVRRRSRPGAASRDGPGCCGSSQTWRAARPRSSSTATSIGSSGRTACPAPTGSGPTGSAAVVSTATPRIRRTTSTWSSTAGSTTARWRTATETSTVTS